MQVAAHRHACSCYRLVLLTSVKATIARPAPQCNNYMRSGKQLILAALLDRDHHFIRRETTIGGIQMRGTSPKIRS